MILLAQSMSIFDPASPPAESIRNLSVLVLAITGFIFVTVEGILIYSIISFRRRAAVGTSLPPERAGESGRGGRSRRRGPRGVLQRAGSCCRLRRR